MDGSRFVYDFRRESQDTDLPADQSEQIEEQTVPVEETDRNDRNFRAVDDFED